MSALAAPIPLCVNGAPAASKTGSVDVIATFFATSVRIVSCAAALFRSNCRRLAETAAPGH